MICRLCLLNYSEVRPVYRTKDSKDTIADSKWIQMINKYLKLELLVDDPISAYICLKCSKHLEDFDEFYVHVAKQQDTLRNGLFDSVNGSWNATPKLEANNDDELPFALCDVAVAEGPTIATHPADAYGHGNEKDAAAEHEHEEQHPRNDAAFRSTRQSSRKTSGPGNHNTARTGRNLSLAAAKHKTKQNEQIINDFMQLHCDICHYPVDTYTNLRIHFNAAHGRGAYVKCCGTVYCKPHKLVEHINWHQYPDIFKCDACSKRLRSKKCLQLHKQTAHPHNANGDDKDDDSLLAKCHICSKLFRSSQTLENHVQKHNADRTFTCEMCAKSFVSKLRLRRHIEAIHENIYPHVCDSCGKKFKFKPSFERHLLEHQGIVEPAVQCADCGDWLKNRHALRLHRFKHDTTDVTCDVCGRVCPSRTALRGHMGYMHKLQRNFKCDFCPKTFKVAKNLEEHIATHTGMQLYACPHCSKECRSKSNMYVHIKRQHAEEWLRSKLARSNDPTLHQASAPAL